MNRDLSIVTHAALDQTPTVRRALSGPVRPDPRQTPLATPAPVPPVLQHAEAARLKSLLTHPDMQVSTHLDDATGRFVLQVESLTTGEVVEQIPSEELLRLYASLRESLVDERA